MHTWAVCSRRAHLVGLNSTDQFPFGVALPARWRFPESMLKLVRPNGVDSQQRTLPSGTCVLPRRLPWRCRKIFMVATPRTLHTSKIIRRGATRRPHNKSAKSKIQSSPFGVHCSFATSFWPSTSKTVRIKLSSCFLAPKWSLDKLLYYVSLS